MTGNAPGPSGIARKDAAAKKTLATATTKYQRQDQSILTSIKVQAQTTLHCQPTSGGSSKSFDSIKMIQLGKA